MRVEATGRIAASRAELWPIVSDPARIATFMARVSRWEVLSDPPTGLGARWNVRLAVGSAPVGGIVEVVEFDPERDLAWNSVTGVAFRGRIRLRPASPGLTQVTLRLSYQAPGGLLGLVADRVARPLVRQTLRRSLDQLRQVAEHPAA